MQNHVKMNNRGVSEIIVIVIFIVLTLFSLGVLINYLKSNTETVLLGPKQCLDFQTYSPIEIKDACQNGDNLEVTLSRQGKEDFYSVDFAVEFENKVETWTCCETCPNCQVQEQGSKKYFLDLSSESQIPKKLTVLINQNCEVDHWSIKACLYPSRLYYS